LQKTITKYFGEMEYQDDSVVVFPEGLLGFEEYRRFLLIQRGGARSLAFLQSLDNTSLCFPVMPAAQVDAKFELRLDAEHRKLLGLAGEGEDKTLALAVVSFDEVEPPTANLLGPVVIHVAAKRGAQVVQFDSGYLSRHPVPGWEEVLSCS